MSCGWTSGGRRQNSAAGPVAPVPSAGVATTATRGPVARVRAAVGGVDHGLERRGVLAALRDGRLTRPEVCDADGVLVRAARELGEPTGPCPVCDAPLREVLWVFGEVGGPSGAAVTAEDLLEVHSRAAAGLRAYGVEVCARCRWSSRLATFDLGTRRPPARPRSWRASRGTGVRAGRLARPEDR